MNRRLGIIFLIIGTALLTSSCQIFVQFFVVNRSDRPLDVVYRFKETGSYEPPRCVDGEHVSGKLVSDTCADGTYSYDPASRTATAIVQPGSAICIDRMDAAYVDGQPDSHFSIENLKLVQGNGSQSYMGDRVFHAFSGEGRDWFTGTALYYQIKYE